MAAARGERVYVRMRERERERERVKESGKERKRKICRERAIQSDPDRNCYVMLCDAICKRERVN